MTFGYAVNRGYDPSGIGIWAAKLRTPGHGFESIIYKVFFITWRTGVYPC